MGCGASSSKKGDVVEGVKGDDAGNPFSILTNFFIEEVNSRVARSNFVRDAIADIEKVEKDLSLIKPSKISDSKCWKSILAYLEDQKKLYEYDTSDGFPPHIKTLPPFEKYTELTIFGISNVLPLAMLPSLVNPGPLAKKFDFSRQTSLSEFNRSGIGKLSGAVDDPLKIDREGSYAWFTDVMFGQQRLQGNHPVALRCCTELPKGFAGSLDKLRELVPKWDSEFQAGNIYLLDYAILTGVKAVLSDPGPNGEQFPRWLPDPIVLFHNTAKEQLIPIYIQYTHDHVDGQTPIFYRPWSSISAETSNNWGWRYAKMCVQAADWMLHELGAHLTWAHLMEETIAISFHRNIHPCHPLYTLLINHFEKTLQLNTDARKTLVPIIIHQACAVGQQGCKEIVGRLWASYDFQSRYFPNDLKNRGIELTNPRMKHYYYGHDGMVLWKAIREYVTAVLSRVYKNDEEVAGDKQLQVFAIEARDLGKINNFPTPITTIDQVLDMSTLIIFNASVHHSAVNYTQEYFMSYIPNSPPGSLWRAPPKQNEIDNIDERFILDSLPPRSIQDISSETLKVLSQPINTSRNDTLTSYVERQLEDKDRINSYMVEPLTELASRLSTISHAIRARNDINPKYLKYPTLDPAMIGASIFI